MARAFRPAFPAVLIALAVAGFVYLNSDVFLDPADEGFLWYGARQVLQGRVPVIDFQAYDPGRYYWCAAVLSLIGDGLMHLRLAMSLFQALGLALGLLALRRAVRSPWALAAAGVLAACFMLIPCRYFNASLPLIALFFATRLAENPSRERHREAGICTGLIAFIALNHGLYVFLAFVSLRLYLHAKGARTGWRDAVDFFMGTVLGSLPWLCLIAAVPGFWQNYIERIFAAVSAFGSGKMHVSLSVPWPWTVSWNAVGRELPDLSARLLEYTNRFSIGALFVIVILYYAAAIPAVLRMKRVSEGPPALFAASVFVGVFYLGHIASRADLVYLGEGIFPVMSGLLAAFCLVRVPLKKVLAAAVLLFFAAGLLAAGLRSTFVFKAMIPEERMRWYPVGKDRIWVPVFDAAFYDNVKKLVAEHAGAEPVFLSPLLAAFYCLLDKESPVYELYFHIPPPPEMEMKEIRQLEEKKVNWAILANLKIDGREEHTFSNSHPRLWAYFMANFEFVTDEGLYPGYFLMRRKT